MTSMTIGRLRIVEIIREVCLDSEPHDNRDPKQVTTNENRNYREDSNLLDQA
jgi:hypothetical protein